MRLLVFFVYLIAPEIPKLMHQQLTKNVSGYLIWYQLSIYQYCKYCSATMFVTKRRNLLSLQNYPQQQGNQRMTTITILHLNNMISTLLFRKKGYRQERYTGPAPIELCSMRPHE